MTSHESTQNNLVFGIFVDSFQTRYLLRSSCCSVQIIIFTVVSTTQIFIAKIRDVLQTHSKKNDQQDVMPLHNNARPHSANLTKNNIQELGCEAIAQPVNSPNLAASDFYLFRSLSNNIQGTSFSDENELGTWFDDFNP